jgi:hypothetical protein
VHAGNGTPEASVATACDAVGLGLELEELDASAETCGATTCDAAGLVGVSEVAIAEGADVGALRWLGSVDCEGAEFIPHADSATRTRMSIAAAEFRTGSLPALQRGWLSQIGFVGRSMLAGPSLVQTRRECELTGLGPCADQDGPGIRIGSLDGRIHVPSPACPSNDVPR